VDAASPPRVAAQVFVADPTAPDVAPEDRHHLVRVLRLTPGELVIASDGAGSFTLCRFTGSGAFLEPTGPPMGQTRLAPPITIGFAPVKGDRPEWVAQKLTELGVDRIVPLVADRSVVRWSGPRAERALERLRRAQAYPLHALLEVDRIRRMTEIAAIAPSGGEVYDGAAMMADVRRALWSELDAKEVRVDAFRRNLEREHLVALDSLLNPALPPKEDKSNDGSAATDVPAVRPNETDSRALARGELVAIRDAARAALPRAADRITRLHLQETIAEVDQSLGEKP